MPDLRTQMILILQLCAAAAWILGVALQLNTAPGGWQILQRIVAVLLIRSELSEAQLQVPVSN